MKATEEETAAATQVEATKDATTIQVEASEKETTAIIHGLYRLLLLLLSSHPHRLLLLLLSLNPPS